MLLCYNSHHNTVFITLYGTGSSDREVRMILTSPLATWLLLEYDFECG